jgi:ABC-type transport system substrate-binding protein
MPARPARIASLAAAALACACGQAAVPPNRALRIAIYDRPRILDPHQESEFVSFAVASHVYEGLTRLDADLRVQPSLAERWVSPDALHWQFSLRPGVRFHDGRPLTAADVVASIERARTHPESDWTSYLMAIEGVHAIDPATIEVVTRRPYSLLLQKLAYILIVPADAPSRIDRPIGTGPYRLVPSVSAKRLTLHAFEGYWGPRVSEPIVHFEIEPSLERALAVPAAERADIVQAVGPEAAALIQRTPGFTLVARAGVTTDYLQLRLSRPPFSDVRVRRAIHRGIDREALVREVLGGRGRAANQLVGPAVFGHDPGLGPAPYDLAEARRLLAEAGYPDGLDVDLEFRHGRRVDPLVAQLAAIGIRARPRAHSFAELMDRMSRDEVAMYYGGAMAGTGDASDVLDSLLHSPRPDRSLGESNSIGYHNPALDALIESASLENRVKVRRATLQHCLRLAMEDLPLVPLVVPEDVYGVSEGIEWQPRLDGRVLGAEVRRRPRAAAVADGRALLLE